MTVQQLMCGAQATAAGAIPAGYHVKETARIETIRGGIDPKENRAARQGGNETAPQKDRAATPHLMDDWRHRARRQWNADFTSGLHKTIRTQMPIGNPITQQQLGVKQGSMERIVAAMTKP